MTKIEIVPYNSLWPEIFEAEALIIKAILGDNCLAIHHVGSTSVPGLVAKPKIDVIAVIQDPTRARHNLESGGYQYRGEYNIPLHYGFSKRGEVDVNLHVYEENHPEIELNLLFRNYLRQNIEARESYGALKEKLILDQTSMEKNNSPFTNYTLRKGEFIRSLLNQAGFTRLRFLKCNDDGEWHAARHFRQKYFFDKVPMEDPYTWTFNHPNHSHFILYKGVEMIGYAHIQLWPEERAALRIIVVEKNKRCQGYGGEFLRLLERWLHVQGYKSLHIESSPEAKAFYDQHGYQEMPFNDPDHHPTDPRDIPIGKPLL